MEEITVDVSPDILGPNVSPGIIIDILDRNWNIYKVPNKLREIRPAAYTPQLVSIGPFHFNDSNLKAMEQYKTDYMTEFRGRPICNHVEDNDLIKFIEKEAKLLVKVNSDILKKFKEEKVEESDRRRSSTWEWDFVCMIMRDAFFILELFFRNHEIQILETEGIVKFQPDYTVDEKQRDEKITIYSRDYIFKSPWVKEAIKQDLILLENQLPYSILTGLFDFIFNHPSLNTEFIPHYLSELKNQGAHSDFLIKITCEFFIDYYRFGKPGPEPRSAHNDKYLVRELMKEKPKLQNIKHFTDLVRKFMHDEKRPFPKSSDDSTRCRYSAKQLDNAGVMFVPREDGKYLNEIEEVGGKRSSWMPNMKCLELKVPQLKVRDNTECIFRNVMALEQFDYPDEPYICNYVFLLDQLINTVEDVDLLVHNKIIDNWLGSNNAVVDLVNSLHTQIVTPRFFYTDICEKLNKHHNKLFHVGRSIKNAKSTFFKVYFKDVWTGSSTVVAIVFLVFSFFSTYSTIKSLFF